MTTRFSNKSTIACAVVLALSLVGCGGSDGSSASDQASTMSTAARTTQPLIINGVPVTLVQAGEAYRYVPSVSSPTERVLSYNVVNKPDWATFNETTGELSGTPEASDVGFSGNIEIGASDGTNSAIVGPFRIRVTADVQVTTTSAGTISVSGSAVGSVTAGQTYRFLPVVQNAGTAPLSFSIVNRPTWAISNTATGLLVGTPKSDNVGTYSNIVISVSGAGSPVSLSPFTIKVNPADTEAPTIAGTPASSVAAGANYSFTPTVTDPSGNALTFSVLNAPSWASFNARSGLLSGVAPTTTSAQLYSNIVISVSNGAESAALAAFSIQVHAPSGGASVATQTIPCVGAFATDDALLKTAFAAGGNITLLGNCQVAETFTANSNTTFDGNGFTVTAAAASNWSGSRIRSFITAANNATQLKFENGSYVWTGATGRIHILSFADNNSEISVDSNTFTGAGDATAMVGATDVAVTNNKAYECSNACFDNWGGTNNADYTNNLASLPTGKTSAQCFLYTGFNTDDTAATATSNGKFIDNTCYINGQATYGQLGFYVEGYASSSPAEQYNITIAHNHVIIANGIWGQGIRVTGHANNIDIDNNIIDSDGLTTANLPCIEANGGSTGVQIEFNICNNWAGQTTGSDQGIFTNKGANGSLQFNQCLTTGFGACSSVLDYAASSTTIQQVGEGTGGGTASIANFTPASATAGAPGL